MNKMYQVQLDESTRLPMSADAVREGWKSGRIQPATRILREGIWTNAYALRDELQLPAATGGFSPRPSLYEEPAAPIAKQSIVGAAVLILAGCILAAFFLFVYETSVLTIGNVVTIIDPQRLQNRNFGVGGGALLILIGSLMAIFRSR